MKQAEKYYLISDAAKQVQVESHVLRYWEDELKLPIKRNEMGHRYYTEEDITRFKEIRNLKEQGLQLKAIRSMLLKGNLSSISFMGSPVTSVSEASAMPVQDDLSTGGNTALVEEKNKRHVVMVNKGEFVPITEESKEAKNIRLQQLLQNMIIEAVRSNNQEVCEEIKESLLKELDYQFRLQEEREDEREDARVSRQEEHYRQIDELLRTRNKKKKSRKKEEMQEGEEKGKEAVMEPEEYEHKPEKPKGGFFQRKKRSIN